MAPLSGRTSNRPVKTLLIGDSGSGKTGSLASLAAAGYKLRIIDLDNGIEIIKSYLSHPKSPYVKSNPKCIENVSYVTLTDPMKNIGGTLFARKSIAWQGAVEKMIEWKDDDEDFGPITSWGPDTVLVIDSLTALSTAAMNFHLFINAALGKTRTQNEERRDMYQAQKLVRSMLNTIYDDEIKCNVILTAHIRFLAESGQSLGEMESDEKKTILINGYPMSIGKALSPHIPTFFNHTLIARSIGYGSAVQHKICTTTQNVGGHLVNAKSAAPVQTRSEYPIETVWEDYSKDGKEAPLEEIK
jgi:hypothetical protein